jgi:hypothetical protein
MIRPMLAHKYNPSRITYPCFIQPKLNGIRGVYLPTHKFQSRYGEIWNSSVVDHALSALTSMPLYLDGEFYCHGMSLQEINSRISVVRSQPHPERDRIKFCIFDVIVDAPFYKRALMLHKLRERFDGSPAISVVKTFEITTESEGDYYYNQWRKIENFEGAMYREACMPYGFASRCGNKENRWHYLQKRKGTQDLVATVVGLKEMIDGKTKEPKGTLGAFNLATDKGFAFDAGSGLTDADRVKYWALGDRMIGTKVRIKFEMFSDGGIPLKPIIECVEYV